MQAATAFTIALGIVVATLTVVAVPAPSPGSPNPLAAPAPGSSLPAILATADPGASVANTACSQRSASIHLSPPTGSATAAIASAYDELGEDGGGTLYLGVGVFTLQSTLDLRGYGNVSIEGASESSTVVQMMPDPVGHFVGTNGLKLGLAPNGPSQNLIEITAIHSPVPNFEMCDLTVKGNANTVKEDWEGSLVYDDSGGTHHVYKDVALTGFWGPNVNPNGLHLIPSPNGFAAVDYQVDHLTASNNSEPFEAYPGSRGGPNFLNIGGLENCHVTNVTGIGLLALEVEPSRNCFFGYWNVSGHMLIDPKIGGSWDGSRFAHIVVSENGTAAPNAIQVDVPHSRSFFTSMNWTDDSFDGPVLDAVNMLSISDSTFYGGLNMLPPTFVGDQVVYTNPGPMHVGLPMQVDGAPGGGKFANVSEDSFSFPSGIIPREALLLNVPNVLLLRDSFAVNQTKATGLFASPDLRLSNESCFARLTYAPTALAPPDWTLVNRLESPGFGDTGAWVGRLTAITNNLPVQGSEPQLCRAILRAGGTVVSNGPDGPATPAPSVSASGLEAPSSAVVPYTLLPVTATIAGGRCATVRAPPRQR